MLIEQRRSVKIQSARNKESLCIPVFFAVFLLFPPLDTCLAMKEENKNRKGDANPVMEGEEIVQ